MDENVDGYAAYLARFIFAPSRSDISTLLGVQIIKFTEAGLAKGTTDELVWQHCQDQRIYLLTDNRRKDTPDSLEATIRACNQPTSLPVFTISDMNRFRTEHTYVEALVARLLEYLLDTDNILGTGRLFLP